MGAIGPLFSAFAFLLVVHPEALVDCSISIPVHAKPMRFVIEPLAFVDITICKDEAPPTIGFAVAPVTFILAPVRPNLNTLTFLLLFEFMKLARVDGAV